MSLVCSGDLVLDEPEPDHWLSGIAAVTRSASLTVGHLEVPHTHRASEATGDVPAPGARPTHLAALARAGFDLVTLAGNHIADCGAGGIDDTLAALDRLGIAHCGAGADIREARAPATGLAGAHRVAVLSYNCVGPETGWATPLRAGCAAVRVDTSDGSPIAPAAPLEHLEGESVAAMCADIRAAKERADLVVVALHKGIVHTPAKLAPYERPAAHAAIDAGADVVVGHHAHLLRGIEIHHGKPIFHGLGNGCVVTRALTPNQDHPTRAAWVEQRKQQFGFEPDPAYALAPFHPEAVNAMLGRVLLSANGRIEAGFIPVHVEAPGRPVRASASRSAAIASYVARITVEAGLPALHLTMRSDMVAVASE